MILPHPKKIIACLLILFTITFIVYLGYTLKNSDLLSQSPPQFSPTPAASPTTSPSSPVELLNPPLVITNNLEIRGTVAEGWMFEGSFVVRLLDSKRQQITQTQAKETVPGSWQEPGRHEFTAKLNFKNPQATTGYLSFEADNPSGLPQNNRVYQLSVKIAGTSGSSKEGEFCGGIAAIKCPSGFTCQLDGSYPDAGGKCVKEAKITGNSKYSISDCPSNGWVDCMPIVAPQRKQFCAQDFLDWAKKNCPNFQGVAY